MFTTRPEIVGTFGVVSSTHWLATAVAMAMLERGGNAFDAAVAAGMVLQVAQPYLNGPGGDLPILIHCADSGDNKVICAQGTAPAGATIAHFRELGLDMIPGTGLLATTVPGAFDGWMLMLRDHGTMSFEDIMEPAIHYAEVGVPVTPEIFNAIDWVKDLFREEWPTSAAAFLPGGATPALGSLFANKGVARTWRRLVQESKAGRGREGQIEKARDAWYRGFVAEAMDRFCRENELMDVSGERHSGVLTADDMAGWQATYEEPLGYDYHGYRVLKTGPWGQGPVFLQQLALLKGFDLSAMDPMGPEFVHTVTECAKLAFADREKFYGDPNFVDVPIGTLLSDDYNDRRRSLIGANQASMDLRPGEVEGYGGVVDYRASVTAGERMDPDLLGIGEPTVSRAGEARGDTCHVDVVDKHGNMVSATPSGGWLYSSPVIEGLGFCLNSRAQTFSLEEGRPTSLAPGMRPRTTLTPSMALKDGKPYLAFGSPGGDNQDQWQPIFFLRHVHHAMNLQEAIDAPSFHNDHFPSSFYPRPAYPGRLVLEGRFPAETAAALERSGHRVEIGPEWSGGRMCVASRDGILRKAGANPRGMQGYAAGR